MPYEGCFLILRTPCAMAVVFWFVVVFVSSGMLFGRDILFPFLPGPLRLCCRRFLALRHLRFFMSWIVFFLIFHVFRFSFFRLFPPHLVNFGGPSGPTPLQYRLVSFPATKRKTRRIPLRWSLPCSQRPPKSIFSTLHASGADLSGLIATVDRLPRRLYSSSFFFVSFPLS